MSTTKVEKCAHPVCSCTTTTGAYCSVECEAMAGMPDIQCHCGHEDCKGDVDKLAASASGTLA